MTRNPDRRRFVAGAAALAATPLLEASFTSDALAQSGTDWPTKPVQVIVPYPPGGATDAIGRMFAQYAEKATGKSFVVENRGGGSGVAGIQAVATAAPDGYTIGCTTSTPINQMQVLLKKLPYNPVEDFAFAGAIDVGALQVLVNKSVPVSNLKELIELAKKQQVNFGTYGPGSFNHVFAFQLNKLFGTNFQAIHYKGESPMWSDVASGQVHAAAGTYGSYRTFLDRGDIKPIGLGGKMRHPNLPDLPLFPEQGFTADIFQGSTGWVGLVVPRKVPAPILARISQLFVEACNSEQGKQTRDIRAYFGPVLDAKQHTEWQRTEAPKWIAYTRDLGFTLD